MLKDKGLGERQVDCRFEDGRLVPHEYGYTVSSSPSGLLIEIRCEGYGQAIAISRFAWKGIVEAVAELQAEAEERAKINVVLDALINGEP
jgi:hypothetical protein